MSHKTNEAVQDSGRVEEPHGLHMWRQTIGTLARDPSRQLIGYTNIANESMQPISTQCFLDIRLTVPRQATI